jgi:carboxyl-terminal processing protease
MPDRYAYLKMGKEMLIMLCLGTKLTLPPIHFGIKQPILIKPFQIVREIAHNDQFKLIEDNAKWIDSRSEENTYSLNIKI